MNYIIIILLIVIILSLSILYVIYEPTDNSIDDNILKKKIIKVIQQNPVSTKKPTTKQQSPTTKQQSPKTISLSTPSIPFTTSSGTLLSPAKILKEYPDITEEKRLKLRQEICPTVDSLSEEEFCKDPRLYINVCDKTSYYNTFNQRITNYDLTLNLVNNCIAKGLMNKTEYQKTKQYYNDRNFEIIDYPTSSCTDITPGNLKFCDDMMLYFKTCKTLDNKGMKPNQYDIDNVLYCASRNLTSEEKYNLVKNYLKSKNIEIPDMPKINCADDKTLCNDPLEYITFCDNDKIGEDVEDNLEYGIISKDTLRMQKIYGCKDTIPEDKFKQAQNYFKNKGKYLPTYMDCSDKTNICKDSKNFINLCNKIVNIQDKRILADTYYQCGVNKQGTDENYKIAQQYFSSKGLVLPNRPTVECGVNMCDDIIAQSEECFANSDNDNLRPYLNESQMTDQINQCMRQGLIIKDEYNILKPKYPKINDFVSVNCITDCNSTNDICKNLLGCIRCLKSSVSATSSEKLAFYNRTCPVVPDNSYETDFNELNQMYPSIFTR